MSVMSATDFFAQRFPVSTMTSASESNLFFLMKAPGPVLTSRTTRVNAFGEFLAHDGRANRPISRLLK